MPTLILEDKSEWAVDAHVAAEFKRLRADNAQLRTTRDKAVNCLVCYPIADPVEICENTLDILLPGWRGALPQEDGVYISRMTVDVPSRSHPGHVHKAGTEIAPVERIGDTGAWFVEVRVPDATLEGGYWWETLELKAKEETEVVLVPKGDS